MKIVTFGEIMLRLAPPGFQRFTQARTFEATYGGGEANVAVSLANYGEVVDFVTRLPKNELGDAALSSLRGLGVGTNHIARGGDRIGIYFLEAGAAQRASKVIYDRAGSSFDTIQPGTMDWKSIFADANWFHWTGITPAVSQGAAEACREVIGPDRRNCIRDVRMATRDCAKAPNPDRCRAVKSSYDKCKEQRGSGMRACMRDNMPPLDCSKAADPERCKATSAAREACKDTPAGPQRRQCMTGQNPVKH